MKGGGNDMADIDPQVFGGLVANVQTLMKQTERSREDQMVANNIPVCQD